MIPTRVGSADITALVADRIVREILTGVAQSDSPSIVDDSAPWAESQTNGHGV